MTELPPQNYSPAWGSDPRAPVPRVGSEREILSALLDWHRETFSLKCAGVPAAQFSEPLIPPSGLTLHGLLRHLAGAERWWFRQQFAGEDLPLLYYSRDAPNDDFDVLDGDPAEVWATWWDECARARQIVDSAGSLDAIGAGRPRGAEISLRWVLAHLIAEYARHNGHADLLRERADGRTGF